MDNDIKKKKALEAMMVDGQIDNIKNKIVILSGKGGVGKSTIASNIAVSLAMEGYNVGLLDIDIHGPSIPKLLGVDNKLAQTKGNKLIPITFGDNLKIMSIGFLLQNKDDAVIWRGPMKMSVIKQFLGDVIWGDLDYLIIDSPPGTGDEPLAIIQLIKDMNGAVIVTTPQQLSTNDVRKSINFCNVLKLPVIGVVENMSGFKCPDSDKVYNIFGTGGGEKMAKDMKVPFLGCLNLDPEIVKSGDDGKPFVYFYNGTDTGKTFSEISQKVIDFVNIQNEKKSKAPLTEENTVENIEKKDSNMEKILRISIPITNEKLSQHFGHCEKFILFDVNIAEKKVIKKEILDAPPHQPGLLPKFLNEKGVNIILACGIGSRAKDLFKENNIEVIGNISVNTPEEIINEYLNQNLSIGPEHICDH